jgi:hypothetical protein
MKTLKILLGVCNTKMKGDLSISLVFAFTVPTSHTFVERISVGVSIEIGTKRTADPPPPPALNQGSRELRKSAVTGITITAYQFKLLNVVLRIRIRVPE